MHPVNLKCLDQLLDIIIRAVMDDKINYFLVAQSISCDNNWVVVSPCLHQTSDNLNIVTLYVTQEDLFLRLVLIRRKSLNINLKFSHTAIFV